MIKKFYIFNSIISSCGPIFKIKKIKNIVFFTKIKKKFFYKSFYRNKIKNFFKKIVNFNFNFINNITFVILIIENRNKNIILI